MLNYVRTFVLYYNFRYPKNLIFIIYVIPHTNLYLVRIWIFIQTSIERFSQFKRKWLEFTEVIIDKDCFDKSCKDANLQFCGHLVKNIPYMSSLPSFKKPWCVALQYCATCSNTLKQPRYSISRYYGRQHILMIIAFGNIVANYFLNIQKSIRNISLLSVLSFFRVIHDNSNRDENNIYKV